MSDITVIQTISGLYFFHKYAIALLSIHPDKRIAFGGFFLTASSSNR
ncbi:MAG: hypothetical protein WCG25_05345 [bacterium]